MEIQEGVNRVEGRRIKCGECVAILKPQEVALLRIINKISYGRIERIEIHDGQPTAVEVATRRTRLDEY